MKVKLRLYLIQKEEVIAGSTRLKAGTAQKICLKYNIFNGYEQNGFIKNGTMTHMVPTNKKLREQKTENRYGKY